MKKPLPIGIEFYKQLVDRPYYYVDKTLIIKKLLDDGAAVSLFTRPRRFGKTLTLTMLKAFFEDERDGMGRRIDNSHYFQGMKIMEAGEAYTRRMGQYPAIFLSLKSAKQPDFSMAYESLVDEITREYVRHRYILASDVLPAEYRIRYEAVMNRQADRVGLAKSLAFLSECLRLWHKNKAVILIDEYDVPLENAFFRGFYPQMTDFIRSFLESALKTNENLEFAVITGCLRISKESIFTGLNNLKINTVLSSGFGEYFGFLPAEVKDMAKFYGLDSHMEEIRQWYDGYRFGLAEVYNPWSVINYISQAVNADSLPRPYWSNTSSNDSVRHLIEQSDASVKSELESLLAGGTLEKPIHEDITYEDIYKTQDNLWNFLFFTGYLKMTGQSLKGNTIYVSLTLPNEEVRYIYENTIQEWFEQKVKQTDLTALYEALKEGRASDLSERISEQLAETISYFDYAENYYHGFLSGLLKGCPGMAVFSNRESGNGRPDLLLKTPSVRGMAILIEIKTVKNFDRMADGCTQALAQIEAQNYEQSLRQEGYHKILKYGICFYRKECLAKISHTE